MTDYGFIRVSTVSQDAQTQKRDILRVSPDAVIVQTDTKAASASKGEHVDAIETLTASLIPGDTVIVTDSSRLDRDPDQWAQMARLVAIKARGANVVDLANPAFGSDDRLGVVMTALHQMEAADKSRTVKAQTYRGISMIRDNNAYYGFLPTFWDTKGERYARQAYCVDKEAVADIYQRVADGDSLLSIARTYKGRKGNTLWVQNLRRTIRFTANHTGVIECSYTYEGETMRWTHEVEPVVDSSLWWRANKVLDANEAGFRKNKGGRPVRPNKWVSGILACPACGEKLNLHAGLTPARNWSTGKPRTQRPVTPKLYCGGTPSDRRSCGQFKGTLAQPVIDGIESMFSSDETEILTFQRIAGNSHELAELEAELSRLNDQPLRGMSRAERQAHNERIDQLEEQIEAFQVVADSYDYAPTGQTVAQMWNDGDDTVKRGMARAVKETWGMTLANHEGKWVIDVGREGSESAEGANRIVDLGNGLCFRRQSV